uniref:DNA topoisomerase n=1 Tax=viral metagenome TaxID=1070528 RepID=A0A6C0BVL5_9ZZZZ
MVTVIVVESPAKAKKIQKYFKDGTKVTSSFGHIIDLPKDKISIDIENNFKPNYQPIPGKSKIIKELRNLSKGNNILLAADDDREGDAIAWHCGKLMKLNFNENNRIIFREISEKSIKKSIQNVHKLNMNSVNAQQARRITDRLVGYSLSPCLWRNIETDKMGLSAGRVQSTLLKILKEHEDKINNYESEYEYEFNGKFNYDNNEINCELFFNDDNIEPLKIMNLLKKDKNYYLDKSDKTQEKKYPGLPLITSTLQQSAQNELGYSVKMTMDIAQKLFENGKITYMRTDSTYISEDFQKTIQQKIVKDYSIEYFQKYNSKKKKVKGAQEAHECIRPTDINHDLNDKWSETEKKLYNLIKKRTIISHMKPSVYNVLTIHLLNEKLKNIGIFKGKFKSLKFEGYLIYSNKDIKTESMIEIPKDSIFKLETCICKDIESQPPQYFNESTIVKKLETSGIGRPSTYASIISTILNRNYTSIKTIPEKNTEIDVIVLDKNNNISEKKEIKKINSQKNRIILTDLGKTVLNYLVKNFSTIVNVEFTSEIEKDLDKVSEGSLQWIDVVQKVYNSFYKEVQIQMKNKNPRIISKKSTDIQLGKYKNIDVIIKEGKYGPYINYDNKNINLKYILQKKSKNSLKLKDVKDLIDYPMIIGKYKNKDISIHIGPYGKYMKYNNKNIKISQNKDYNLEEYISLIK